MEGGEIKIVLLLEKEPFPLQKNDRQLYSDGMQFKSFELFG